MNLGEGLEEVYRSMHDDIVNGIATGGSATTIIDTTLNGKYQTNKFKNWVAFVKKTSDALSPQNKFSTISTFASSPATATIATVTDGVEAGDSYSFCKATIPLYTMIDLFNDGLKRLGRVVELDDTSLTTETDTLRYTLPSAVKGIAPRAVFLMDSDYTRLQTPLYRIIPASGISPETLEFQSCPLEGKTIVYKYLAIHPKISVYSDPIYGKIHDELAIASVLERAYWWKAKPKRRKIDMENWADAKRLLAEAMVLYKIEMPQQENQRLPVGIFN